jgi:hypothetical protein
VQVFGHGSVGVAGVAAVALIASALSSLAHVDPSTAAERAGATFGFNLATGSVRGYAVIGKTYPSVVRALGKPDHRSIRKGYGTASYGTLQQGSWPLMISFARRHGALRAWSVAITSPLASEARLGRILRSSPQVIQSKISRAYSDQLRLARPYRCSTRPRRCRGDFNSTTDEMKVGFGLILPRPPSARYIVIYD